MSQPELAETSAAAVLDEIRRHYEPTRVEGEPAVILLTLTDEAGSSTWLLRAAEQLEAEPADPDSQAAPAHVEMSATTYRQLLAGEANRFDAVLDGRIRVRGDVEEAARFSWGFHGAEAH